MKKLVLKDLPNAEVLSRPQMKQLSGGYDASEGKKDCKLYCGSVRPIHPVWQDHGPCPSSDEVARLCGNPIPAGTSCNCV